MIRKRCEWPKDEINITYHDEEWGVPVHDDRKLFEFLVLDAAQAGLSWTTILKRREGYRKAFSNFDPVKVSKYTKKDQTRLLNDVGIIRNRLKILSAINNAKEFLKIQKEYGSFDKYIWNFVNHKTIKHKFKKLSQIPATSVESEKMSMDLKKHGFNFVGPTICYAFMQAAGLVNDHTVDCFRYRK